MLFGGAVEGGALEMRRRSDGSVTLGGRFPYNTNAVLSDGGREGRPRKERFASRAFEYRVNDPDAEIHFLVGHDFDHPLASKKTGTLSLRDSDEALTFTAIITRAIAETTHGRDALALIATGLAVGISPGFRLPPSRVVPEAETVEQEADDGSIDEQGQPRRGAIIRTITSALLFELSLVTRPAYSEAQVEMRNWDCTRIIPVAPRIHATSRWR